MPPPTIGTQLGSYRIEALLGRGGMGVVYRAEDLRLGRKVALKLLASHITGDARFRSRFLVESRLAASIDHGGIVPIYEAGESDGQLYSLFRARRIPCRRDGQRGPARLTCKQLLAYAVSVGDVFKALADPTRRKLLDELAEREAQTLFELCSRMASKHQLAVTRQAISQHLDLLEDAGLVKSRREGRYRFHDLQTAPLESLTDRWLKRDRTEAR